MKVRIGILVLATALAAAPVAAEDSPSIVSLMRSLRLPGATQEARHLGVHDRDIRDMFGIARENHFTAGDLTDVFEARNASIREYGPVDNFGAFVQAKHRQGLRGRDLAAAIRAEHAEHGMGKGHMNEYTGHSEGRGESGVSGNQGRKPGNADKVGPKGGKPDGAGKSGERGGKPDASKKGKETKGNKGGSE
jgi:hypothetical protein